MGRKYKSIINSYIDVNNKIGITRLETILKTLFIRLNSKDNRNNNDNKMVIKYKLSDILLELIEKDMELSINIFNLTK